MVWCLKRHSELSFGEGKPSCPSPQASIQDIMPKAKTKSLPAEEMAGEEEAPLHGVINEEEAKLYVQKTRRHL